MKSSPAHVWYVTIDCEDPHALATFWSMVLGLEVKGGFDPEGNEFCLMPNDEA